MPPASPDRCKYPSTSSNLSFKILPHPHISSRISSNHPRFHLILPRSHHATLTHALPILYKIQCYSSKISFLPLQDLISGAVPTRLTVRGVTNNNLAYTEQQQVDKMLMKTMMVMMMMTTTLMMMIMIMTTKQYHFKT